MVKYGKRLAAAAAMINECEVLADIGSDHGYLPVFLLYTGKIKRAIITDINNGPLNNAAKNAEKFNVGAYCDFRLGSGLSPLKAGEVDAISVCGMGGELIANILKDGIDVAKSADKLVLQPQNKEYFLRKYLNESGFTLSEHRFVTDGRLHYQLMSAKYTGDKGISGDAECMYPLRPAVDKDIEFKNLLLYHLSKDEKIIRQINAGSRGGNDDVIKAARERIKIIRERLKLYES